MEKRTNTAEVYYKKWVLNGFRKVYPEYWVKFIKDIVKIFPEEWDYIIIPDCRFKNEIESWKRDGFDVSVVRMERQDFSSELTEEQKNHASEIDLDDYTFDMHFIVPDGYSNIINCANDYAEVVLDE